MGYKVTYNDIQLDSFMGILKVKRSVLPSRENFSKKIPSRYGEVYTGFTYSSRVITLECYIKATSFEDHMEQVRIIADILNVDAPKKMTISDEEGKYFYAVVDGDIDVERIYYHGSFTLTFICHDPYTYAEEPFEVIADEKNIITVENSGSVETQPIVQVGFQNQAHFLQVTNYTGETVLIGQRPSVDKPQATGDVLIVNDKCDTLANWNPSGNVLDSGREVMGGVRINGGGYAIIPNDFGTSDKGWHGPCYRRNMGANVTDFRFEAFLEHSTRGDVNGIGATASPPSTSTSPTGTVQYTITADPSLRIRSGRGTSYKTLGTIPKGKIVNVSSISGGWGYTTYNGITGYISMSYCAKYVAPSTSTTTSSTYQATQSVNVRATASNSGKILTVAQKGQKVTVSSTTKDGWHKMTINGKTGYSYKNYWKKVSSTRMIRATEEEDKDSHENKMGRIEVYGFDIHGTKLFKFELTDSQQWYEYTDPSIYIGNELVLDDNKNVPSPKTATVKDPKDENKTITKFVDSGTFGDWNRLRAWFKISRTTNAKGEQVWTASVERVVSNKVTKTIKTNTLTKSTYPKGDLNHIVVWFGAYKDLPPVSLMSIKHVNCYNLKPVKVEENTPIFRKGDELMVDFEEQKVYLNDREFMDYVDIGSEFFSCPSGESQFICQTDDKDADIHATIQEKWI